MKKEEVNKKYTRTWEKLNNDSKQKKWRRIFLEHFGGEFIKHGRYVEWKESEVVEEPATRIISIINPNGEEDLVENFSKYCRDRELNRAAMYEVLKGKRSQYKGYTIKGE
jgi:hypothetical protein